MPESKPIPAPRPGVYTIPPGVPFLDALARGVLEEAGSDPLALSGYRILLPTRRAVRSLAEAFLRLGAGEAMLLPRLTPIGDVDEDELSLALAEAAPDAEALAVPPAIPELRRRLLLAELIVEQAGSRLDTDHAIRLAAELARLVDQVQTEGLDFADLDRLVPADYAEHWQITLDFLRLVTSRWPERLAEEGAIEPADRRNRLLAAQAERWAAAPPPGQVIAAGSTGSIPATADLLAAVAGLPRGRVVLPGLDQDTDDESWRLLSAEGPTHPQHGLARLLARIGLDRNRVGLWPGVEIDRAARARARFLAEATRPAERTDAWRRLASEEQKSVTPASVAGLRRITCPTPREEAAVIALLLREVLEEPGRTAALITPDRPLARRVAAELRRWGVEIDDSAGQPLSATPVGAFLRLCAHAAAEGFAPVPLLALLKHPLAAAGQAPARLRARVRALERAALRGPRPGPGLSGLRRAIESLDEVEKAAERADALALVDDLTRRVEGFAPLLAERRAGLADLIAAHLAFAEALAESDEKSSAARLWRGEDGEAAAALMAELHSSAGGLPPVAGADYPSLFEALIAGPVVRPRWGRHPRLFIWGPLEARLLHADRLILGSLNEGVWPADQPPDPWLSRPMRSNFGLPLPERRIGLSAHDFAQALGARDVVMTRAERAAGAPTVASRWLLRLETTMRAAGLFDADPAVGEAWDGGPWQAWQDRLDRPDRPEPSLRPEPRPPFSARPRRLSVTAIGTLMRNPYGIYARYVLGLKALDPLDADPGAAERGGILHAALAAYLGELADASPEAAHARLLQMGEQAFGATLDRPGVRAFWWPRFERIAGWFLAQQAALEPGRTVAAVEAEGWLDFESPGGPFRLTARADRIDRLADGGLAVIDYKTGQAPTAPQVEAGLEPQLPLEAAIACFGGFEGVAAGEPAALAYWRLTGGDPAGEIREIRGDAGELATVAFDGLRDLIAAFDDPDTPYHAVPDPARAPRFDDYAHLARIAEWSAGGGSEE